MGSKPRKFRPTSVTIRHHEWPIYYVDPEHPALATADGNEHNLGVCDCHKREIYIDVTQSPESMLDTIYHEIAHAFVLGSGEFTEYDREERAVCLMTAYILELEAAGLLTLAVKP